MVLAALRGEPLHNPDQLLPEERRFVRQAKGERAFPGCLPEPFLVDRWKKSQWPPQRRRFPSAHEDQLNSLKEIHFSVNLGNEAEVDRLPRGRRAQDDARRSRALGQTRLSGRRRSVARLPGTRVTRKGWGAFVLGETEALDVAYEELHQGCS